MIALTGGWVGRHTEQDGKTRQEAKYPDNDLVCYFTLRLHHYSFLLSQDAVSSPSDMHAASSAACRAER
jgi:hypothetical protein